MEWKYFSIWKWKADFCQNSREMERMAVLHHNHCLVIQYLHEWKKRTHNRLKDMQSLVHILVSLSTETDRFNYFLCSIPSCRFHCQFLLVVLALFWLYVFHRLTHTAYLYNGCLAWYNVELTLRVHSSVKYSQQSQRGLVRRWNKCVKPFCRTPRHAGPSYQNWTWSTELPSCSTNRSELFAGTPMLDTDQSQTV